MSTHGEMSEELSRLLIEMIDGRLRPIGAARLSQILREDDDAVNAYVRYVGIHSLLDWRFARPLAAPRDENGADGAANGSNVSAESLQGQYSLLGFHYSDSGQADDEPEPLPSPPVWPRTAPPRKPRWTVIAIVSAAAVLTLAIGIAAVLLLRGPSPELAKRGRIDSSAPGAATRAGASQADGSVAPPAGGSVTAPPAIPEAPVPTAPVVPVPAVAASVTVAIGVDQTDPTAPLVPGAPLVQGQRVQLTRGYVELTFGGGARAIVEAPSDFTIDSHTAMSLRRGRVAATAAGRAHGFVVRTSDADVTDLGTQFGVASDPAAGTDVHVFEGEVTAAPRASAAPSPATVLAPTTSPAVPAVASTRPTTRPARLKAGDAATLPPAAAAVKVLPGRASPQKFVRNLSSDARVLDAVDLVCGGDGTTKRRGTAIDLKTGQAGKFDPVVSPPVDGEYHRVAGIPVLDGCFLPISRFGPTPVDSAGNTFTFPENDGSSFEHIRTGGSIGWPVPGEKFSARLGGVDYAAAGHGFLFMHSNKGLTFDVDAIRRLYPGARLARFQAVLGNTFENKNAVRADAFVLADGKAKFERRGFTNLQKPARIDVPVDDAARFLTLAVTDGGDAGAFDWVIFGDPVFVFEKR